MQVSAVNTQDASYDMTWSYNQGDACGYAQPTTEQSIISEKKALREDKTVVLTKECSALIQTKLPKKMPDLGSFLISCTIGTSTFEKALCDLGSSINIVPLSVIKKLGIEEAQPTRITLEMADESWKQAYGLVENVLVKVG
ncbi:uncharacterized protein LOC107615649 [Arachis ipaensis]|uniref:uncharacterized protein LOC107615649 n=1 Tax=Arachis ipaensis TaxID=130454 RepID=UPI0007AFAFDD|nr:uncharacterized protein LOC107615649 [Arachis ipaensis]